MKGSGEPPARWAGLWMRAACVRAGERAGRSGCVLALVCVCVCGCVLFARTLFGAGLKGNKQTPPIFGGPPELVAVCFFGGVLL